MVDLIRTPGQFTEALAFLENRRIPAAARFELFEGLMVIVRDGPELEEEEEDEDDSPFDPSYFVAVEDWIVKHTAALDAGLPEAVLECFVYCSLDYVSEALCPRQTAAFHRAVERVPAGGARIRLLALQKQVRDRGQ